MAISKVWFIEGCTVCNLCESMVPEVFAVPETGVVLKPDAASFYASKEAEIKDAVTSCPAEVIKFE
jgi:ferredoxin